MNLRTELARKIASFIGSKEKLITDVPGLLLSRRTAPTAPAPATYEPSLAVVAQGRKRASLGGTTFIFDESRYLLTSLNLPVVCNVIEASEDVPYLCFVLKLEMPVVRELLSREEIQSPEAPSDSPAMATGETTTRVSVLCLGFGIVIASAALLFLRRRDMFPARACLVGLSTAYLANAALCLVVYSAATGTVRSRSGWLVTMVIVWPMVLELVWIFIQTPKTQPSQNISPAL